MVTQISTALPFPNFHSGESYVKKNNSVHYLVICANFSFKIEKFELKVVGVDISGTVFCFRAAIDISYREIAAKLVTAISFKF